MGHSIRESKEEEKEMDDLGRGSGVPDSLKMIKKLLDLGVSYYAKDIEGNSPLDLAMLHIKRGGVHEQIVKVICWYKSRDEKGRGRDEKMGLDDLGGFSISSQSF